VGGTLIAQILSPPPAPQGPTLPWLRIVLGAAAIASVAGVLWLATRRANPKEDSPPDELQ
jgi:hypothetical protein